MQLAKSSESNYALISHIGHVFGNKIRGLLRVNKVALHEKYSRIIFSLCTGCLVNLSITSHQTVYPEDETLAETSVLAIGKTENDIPVFLNGVSGIGQEEELSYTVYGDEGVLKLRNWSELSIAQKDSPFEILTSFDSVKTLTEECIAAANGEECATCVI